MTTLVPRPTLALPALLMLMACRPPAEGPPDLVLANVTVIDGRGIAPAPGQTIEIRDGKISKIRAARDGRRVATAQRTAGVAVQRSLAR